MSGSVSATTLAYVSTAAAVAGAGMSIMSGVSQANAAASSAAFQQQQYRDRQDMLRLQAAQDESARRTQLDKVLQSQRALMAARGINADDSGSFATIQEDSKANAEKDIFNARLGYLTGIQNAQLGSYAAGAEGQAGYSAGLMKAGSGFLSGATSAATSLNKINWGDSTSKNEYADYQDLWTKK